MLDLRKEVLRMPWREVTRVSLRKEFVLFEVIGVSYAGASGAGSHAAPLQPRYARELAG
jgi:hypothetical protein